MQVGLAALPHECERVLFAGARSAASRQQVRAAARRFVRRHRADAGYLVWVLRTVTARSALAAVLLGLSAAPAGAVLAPFGPGSGDPLTGQSAGTRSAPVLVDLDGDGDLDVVAGTANGTFFYFANTGSAEAPAFAAAGNPLATQDAGDNSIPAFGDLDGDGDLDLVAGGLDGGLHFFRNTGNVVTPGFVAVTGAGNPLNGQDVGAGSAPALGDLDRDGDLDLVVGESSGGFRYFENTGTEEVPAFVERTGAANPLDGQDVGADAVPALGDLDGDGDLDLVAGEGTGVFFTFENTGKVTSPAFAARTGADNPLNGQNVGSSATPAVGDLDGDGDPDLVAGEQGGAFHTLFNRAGRFTPRTGAANPLNGQDVGIRSTTALGDLNGDTRLDLISGNTNGQFNYFVNTGTAANPAFSGTLLAPDVGSLSAPALGDLDGDGDLDLVSGEKYGAFFYFENTGSAANPAFLERTGAANPMNGKDVGNQSAPALGDLDGDGDLDLVSGEYFGTFLYYENTGTSASPAFVQRTGTANPLASANLLGYSKPALADVDADGDLDLVAGAYPFHYFENTGTPAVPKFVQRTGAANPLVNQIRIPPPPFYFPAPSLGDLDGDGDLDLVTGRDDGTFGYYQRVAPDKPPVVDLLTGSANPLAGQDIGALSGPALVDLDADGDGDLVVGVSDGTFRYFENTGGPLGARYAERTGAANWLQGRDVGDEARPTFGNLDGDDDFDLLAGNSAGNLTYYENTGSQIAPIFVAPLVNPFGLNNVGSSSSPALADLDRDGDLDLVVGRGSGGLAYFENTANADNPAFVERTGAANPFDGLALVSQASPAIGDFDHDGDLDVVVGSSTGTYVYLENRGGVTHPHFAARTGSQSPLSGKDVGDRAAPTTADLDGDGDADLVTGSLAGTFAVYYFPEPARGLLLAAGIPLVRWLARRREREHS
jgi:hypothetical protein